MTRTEAIKEFFKKAVLPVAIAGLLYCIFKSACIRNGELDLLWLWILCGLPFGIHRMCVWIVPGGSSLGGGAALFALNFIIGGLIGGFPTARKHRFPQLHKHDRLRTFPQRLLRRIFFLSCPIRS